MSRLFSHNAFSILGLDTSASQREIIRRSKDIIKFLSIDQTKDYPTDIASINKTERSDFSVNDAVQRLNSPIKRIREYFFWFEIENEQDEKNLDLLRDNQYDEALEDWKIRAEKSLTSKRNFAIASSLLLNNTGYNKYLKQSLNAWKDVVESDRFWSHFEKVYALNDEVGTSKAAVEDFRGKVIEYLSDFYNDVSRRKKDNSIYAAFSVAFGVKSKKVQDEVLGPIFERVNSTSEKLEGLNVSEDSIISPQEVMAIKRLVKRLQDSFQEIKELGLFEDSHVKVMRDKAADAVSAVSLDLFSNLGEFSKSAALDKIALSFASGPAVISRINKDIDITSQAMSREKVIKPINELIEKEKYSEALGIINELQEKYIKDAFVSDFFRKRIQWCVTAIASKDFKLAHDKFEAKEFDDATGWFQGVFEFVYQYIDNFEIDKESLDNVLNALRNKLATANANTLSDIDNYRQSIIDNSDESIKDKEKFELTIMTILLDSLIYQRLAELIPVFKRRNSVQRAKNTAGSILSWIVGIVILGAIGSAFNSGSSSNNSGSSSPSPSSSSSSAWNTCSGEYDSLKSQLNSIESSMDSYKINNEEAYNNLVPKQNSLVQQVNDKATECNRLR